MDDKTIDFLERQIEEASQWMIDTAIGGGDAGGLLYESYLEIHMKSGNTICARNRHNEANAGGGYKGDQVSICNDRNGQSTHILHILSNDDDDRLHLLYIPIANIEWIDCNSEFDK